MSQSNENPNIQNSPRGVLSQDELQRIRDDQHDITAAVMSMDEIGRSVGAGEIPYADAAQRYDDVAQIKDILEQRHARALRAATGNTPVRRAINWMIGH